MKVICAWCKKPMGEKEPLDNTNISHGICPDCFAEVKKDISKISILRAEGQKTF